MKLTKKAEYAIRALLALADGDGQTARSVRSLAEEHDLPRKFLEVVMRDLRQAGLVESEAGKQGGYRLAMPPRLVTLGGIREAVGSGPAEGERTRDGDGDPVTAFLEGVEDEVERLLRETTLEDVMRGDGASAVRAWQGAFVYGDGI